MPFYHLGSGLHLWPPRGQVEGQDFIAVGIDHSRLMVQGFCGFISLVNVNVTVQVQGWLKYFDQPAECLDPLVW